MLQMGEEIRRSKRKKERKKEKKKTKTYRRAYYKGRAQKQKSASI